MADGCIVDDRRAPSAMSPQPCFVPQCPGRSPQVPQLALAPCDRTKRMNPRRFLPALFVLFIGSGCAALIYEIVWFQLLQLVIGSSAISLGILLGTFMGGMCLGSLALPRVISARRHPLQVYAALEAGIGIFALLILFGMPLVGGVYTAWAGGGVAGIVLRAIAAGICLL